MRNLPITEKDISKAIGRTIKSPIRISNLSALGIDQAAFIQQYRPYFEELEWDEYDPRRLRVKFLVKAFPKEEAAILKHFKDYYTGVTSKKVFKKWIKQLDHKQKKAFKAIHAWRRRSVAKFKIKSTKTGIRIQRVPVPQFAQAVKKTDVRSWPRVFEEAPAHHVDNPVFRRFLIQIFRQVQACESYIKKASITAHFMSVKATSATPGDNSPEGAHEDGAAYIVSALVINRFNVTGGETQILEQVSKKKKKKEMLLKYTLQPGEFAFQADTGEEHIFGNDLWHHVTPFHLTDPKIKEGWRDIIGLDVVIKE